MNTDPPALKGSTPFRQLLILSWPIMVSRSSQAVIGLADALMVTHLGTEVLAAVTTGGLNGWALMVFPMGISFLVASFASQLTGRGDAVAARRFGWYGLVLAGLTQLVAFASIPLIQPVFGAMGFEPGLTARITAYLTIRFLSSGAAIGVEALGNYYSGLGNTAVLMKINLLAMGLNLLLNWLLIDGNLGFPALGLRGAAWASVMATVTAFAVFLVVFLRDRRGRERSPLRMREFKRLLRFGLPSGLNFALEFFAFVFFVNVVVGSLGAAALAAIMAVIQLNSIAFMPAFGMGSAGAVLVGQAIGAGHRDRVPGLAWMTCRTAAGWMGLVGVVYWFFPETVIQPFIPGSGDVEAFTAAAVQVLMLSALWQLFDATGISLSESLRAAGDTMFPMWARTVIGWLIFVPGSWIHVRLLGAGVGAAAGWLMAYLVILSVVLVWRFQGGAWRKIELVEPSVID